MPPDFFTKMPQGFWIWACLGLLAIAFRLFLKYVIDKQGAEIDKLKKEQDEAREKCGKLIQDFYELKGTHDSLTNLAKRSSDLHRDM